MTELEHRSWIRVCQASKAGRWYAPATRGEAVALARLRRHGYFRNSDNVAERAGRVLYRLVAFCPEVQLRDGRWVPYSAEPA